jgi:hypothetical protein
LATMPDTDGQSTTRAISSFGIPTCCARSVSTRASTPHRSPRRRWALASSRPQRRRLTGK